MKISNYIVYHNPLGQVVRDYMTDSQIKSLIRSGYVRPYDYELRGNFRLNYPCQFVYLEFHYNIHSISYPDVL